jgi:hypothetical protein
MNNLYNLSQDSSGTVKYFTLLHETKEVILEFIEEGVLT